MLGWAVALAAGAAQTADRTAVEAKGVRTVQDALAALDHPPPRRRGAPNMKPVPVGNPGAWFSPDDYPPAAQRGARQGRVVVAVGVDSVGKVVTCNVEQSSGTAILDARTCELAQMHGQFDPATDRRGRPTAGEYLLPVRWVLPDTPPVTIDAATAGDYADDLTIEYRIAPDGTLAGCRVLSGAPPKAVTALPCPPDRIGKPVSAPFRRDGRAVGATIVRHETQMVTVDP